MKHMPKQSDDITLPGDEPQETYSGLKIPTPKREYVDRLLRKAAKKRNDEVKPPAPRDPEKQ